MRTEASVELLRRTRLFAGLSEPTLRALADRSLERSFPRHGRLFYQGDPGTGLVKLVVTSEDGEELVLITLGPGEALGELSVVDGGPRSASAEALEPTVVLMIIRQVLLELAARDRALIEALLQVLGGLLQRLTEQASDLVFLDLPGRMANLLAGPTAERGLETPEGVELDAAMTQNDLAGMVGGVAPERQPGLAGVHPPRLPAGPGAADRHLSPRPAASACRSGSGVGWLTDAFRRVPDSWPGPDREHPGTGSWRSRGPPGGKKQVMNEQQRRDEELEGHAYRWDQDTEATEQDQVAGDTCSGTARPSPALSARSPPTPSCAACVLSSKLTGKGVVFAAGLRWAIANRMQVINLSLSTDKREYFALFHELVDQAYFANVVLVCAVNVPGPTYQAEYPAVFSVAANDATDPYRFDYNATPPVEFGGGPRASTSRSPG
jgi:CRP/FNR family cyclic AMP-dependent transcriptional regulator